mmetsp:Transcript_3236/g.7027  ORF Transcript_3236/g.7027 Transcript_3236/m.7027 type:complete len:82 (-) Transcript_3236:675-920(-)
MLYSCTGHEIGKYGTTRNNSSVKIDSGINNDETVPSTVAAGDDAVSMLTYETAFSAAPCYFYTISVCITRHNHTTIFQITP